MRSREEDERKQQMEMGGGTSGGGGIKWEKALKEKGKAKKNLKFNF